MLVARALLLLLVAGGLALAYVAVDGLVLGPIRYESARIEALSGELDGLDQRRTAARARLAQLPQLASVELPSGLVATAASPTLSAAALQQTIRDAIIAVGGSPLSSQAAIQPLPGGYARINVLVQARFSEMGLLTFARSLESATPPVIFDAFEVHPAARDESGTLEFTGTLSGFHADAP